MRSSGISAKGADAPKRQGCDLLIDSWALSTTVIDRSGFAPPCCKFLFRPEPVHIRRPFGAASLLPKRVSEQSDLLVFSECSQARSRLSHASFSSLLYHRSPFQANQERQVQTRVAKGITMCHVGSTRSFEAPRGPDMAALPLPAETISNAKRILRNDVTSEFKKIGHIMHVD